MGNNSTKVNSFKVIQGGKSEVVKSTKALTHKDIKEFLAKFAEAILVDQGGPTSCRGKSCILFTTTVCGKGIAKIILARLLNCP
jgi:hypothetical protein